MACNSFDVRHVAYFTPTKAYGLAKAIAAENEGRIEKIVLQDPNILYVTEPDFGMNALQLSVEIWKVNSMNKLLALGADPNFVNPIDSSTALLSAISFKENWDIDLQFMQTLLDYGANPNYSIENAFDSKNGGQRPSSPLYEASGFNFEAVKILLDYGANPYHKLGFSRRTPFSNAVRQSKFEIINYFIDTLKVNVHEPMSRVIQKPSDKLVVFYIQDYIINKYTKAKIMNNTIELRRLEKEIPGIREANKERWDIIEKLKGMGVDFKNYQYVLK